MRDLAVYIHIPFCDNKCIYCDFYSVINFDNQAEYFRALKKEIDFYAANYSSTHKISTVYFGGGTPSLSEVELIDGIIKYLNKKFKFNPSPEITLEANPGTVNPNKLKALRNAGINRLSLGVQSFNDKDLKFLTRIHNSQTALRTIEDAAKTGFSNLNVDLIFNLPGQTIADWEKNLKISTSLPVTHISAYSLIIERGTVLKRLVNKGKVKLASADYEAELYLFTIDFLTSKGFLQYEVSNFAIENFESRHNLFYWHYKDYLGLGTAAHSFIDGKRWWNYSNLSRYLKEINSKSSAVKNSEILNEKEMIEEYVMLNLRSDGLDLNLLKKKFGGKWKANNNRLIEELVKKGLIIKTKNKLRFTPEGYAICDEILLNFNF